MNLQNEAKEQKVIEALCEGVRSPDEIITEDELKDLLDRKHRDNEYNDDLFGQLVNPLKRE